MGTIVGQIIPKIHVDVSSCGLGLGIDIQRMCHDFWSMLGYFSSLILVDPI